MKIESLKLICVILLTTILINPVVLFIISDNIFISFFIYLGSLILVIILFTRRKSGSLYFYLISILTTISLLIHAEAIFISNFKDFIIEDLYATSSKYYFNRPYLKKQFREKEFFVNYVTNKQGLRIGLEDNPETEILNVDWMFIGDSYTQGAQVEFEELYTSKLNKVFPEKIILNCGISGWGLPDEYNYYKKQGYKYHPKKVFLQICNFNDFMNVNEREASFTDLMMNHSEFIRFILYPYKYTNPAELPLGRWTEPFYPDEESNKAYNIFFKSKSAKQKEDLLKFENYLKLLNEEVIKNGAELFVIQIPTKEQLYYKYFEEVINSFNIDVGQLDMDFPNTFLAEICKKYAIHHLDLFEKFGELENEVFYQFDEHLNAYGHEQLTKILINQISDSGELPTIRMLSHHNTEDRYPILVDENVLTFQSVRDSNIELFISDSIMNSARRITFNNVDELHPWFDHKNSKLIFTEGDQSKGNTKVIIMNLDGTNRVNVTKDGLFGAIPSLSIDGKKIAYAEWTMDAKTRMTNPCIVVLDLDHEKKIKITSDSFESWRPIFSPDQNSLYYISKRDNGKFDIYQYNLITLREKNLTTSDYDEWDPSISPDGKTLIYAGFKDNNWDLFSINIDTKEKRQLTKTLGNEWDPSFSRDGRSIYYAGVYGFMNGIYQMKYSQE